MQLTISSTYNKILNIIGIATALSIVPKTAAAHIVTGQTAEFIDGLIHPLTGADHMLAMVAVGLLAAQIGGRALWAVPGTFVSVMLLGGVLGMLGFSLPFVETGILGSLLALGTLIASSVRVSTLISACIVGTFAIFHGYAHGIEIPLGSGAVAYGIGFAITTASLHGLGILSGLTAHRYNFKYLYQLAGSIIALSGLYLAIY